jgi:branched-chain amino acid transport system ATP-binding protein
MLVLDKVCTFYGTTQILFDVSLEVEKGSVVALLGRNGMGKTTTVYSIVNFVRKKSGKIYFEGKDITSWPSYKIARLGLGLIPQGRRIYTSCTIEENLILGSRRESKGEYSLDTVYELFPILKDRRHLRAGSLSGGQQQMLAIGRALMSNPELILMDEPSEGLAPLIVREVGNIINKMKESGIPVLLVEQNLGLVFDVADSVYIISKGEIVHHSSMESFRSDKDTQANYLFIG